jgi:hypothetical protein
MAKRSRRRAAQSDQPRAADFKAPTSTYSDPEHGDLELRGSLTPKARSEYASVRSGGLNQEDAWQRAAELLFERLAVSWTIAGLPIERQQELLKRYRVATVAERRFVREAMREHLAENFPEMQAP